MTLIVVMLVLFGGTVSYLAPMPSPLITCDQAMLDNVAAYVPPHYGSFAELMMVEAGVPAFSARVMAPNCAVSIK